MGKLDDAAMRLYRLQAQSVVQFLDALEALDYGRRRRLVHRARGVEVLDRLEEPDGWSRFESEAGTMTGLPAPLQPAAVRKLVADWSQIRDRTRVIQRGLAQAVAQVAPLLTERSALEALEDAEGRFGEAVRTAGYRLDDATAAQVAMHARRRCDWDDLEQALNVSGVRTGTAARMRLLPGQVDARILWRFLSRREYADWYLSRLREEGGTRSAGLDADRVVDLARRWHEHSELAAATGLARGDGAGVPGPRMAWLLAVSAVVCFVGISNAMLMSVTQRFRDIATLKCLGRWTAPSHCRTSWSPAWSGQRAPSPARCSGCSSA